MGLDEKSTYRQYGERGTRRNYMTMPRNDKVGQKKAAGHISSLCGSDDRLGDPYSGAVTSTGLLAPQRMVFCRFEAGIMSSSQRTSEALRSPRPALVQASMAMRGKTHE